MKGKITLAISIGCVAFILTMIIFTQFKTVEETDITAIETMRETELREEIASWKTKYDEVDAKLKETENIISEYNQELNNSENSSKILEEEVKEAEKKLGYTDVKGEGIIVTISDGEKNIEYYDILDLINELNAAGAEAISVNDERIVSTTDIKQVELRIILVNTRKISGPYTIKAIGDKKAMEAALVIKGGYVDRLKIVDGKGIEIKQEDNIVVPAYTKDQKVEYMKENKEE
ncbi:MAG TPA: DUF881 domain-containing protein [Candidatus Scatovivens faecipullorum]|nr:DUF881 domain-containing protein [Candidatus Scatovivens faecipullorum]